MKRVTLGQSEVEVSAWCLGTMTFAGQTPQAEAHAQMDMALAAGISFMDCAELYPVAPVRAETVGDSERVLGAWLAQGGRRAQVEIATKVAGVNGGTVRDGAGFSGAVVRAAVDASLARLGTDMVDLYQLHWPNRGSYHFRQNWGYDPRGESRAEVLDHMADVLEAMEAMVRAGKVRAFGLSNETAWGTLRWIDQAAQMGAPRVASIQNEYSLLCRHYDTDMAELTVQEGLTLLAYSPLAAGLLTGKYQNGAVPEGSRMSRVDDLGGRRADRAFEAVAAYHALAAEHGVDPVHMALAWTTTRPFACVPIVGATRLGQLEHIIAGLDTQISPELGAAIDALHRAHPLPF